MNIFIFLDDIPQVIGKGILYIICKIFKYIVFGI